MKDNKNICYLKMFILIKLNHHTRKFCVISQCLKMENLVVILELKNIYHDTNVVRPSRRIERIKTILKNITNKEIKEIFSKWIDLYKTIYTYNISDDSEKITNIVKKAKCYWYGSSIHYGEIHKIFFNILMKFSGFYLLENTFNKILLKSTIEDSKTWDTKKYKEWKNALENGHEERRPYNEKMLLEEINEHFKNEEINKSKSKKRKIEKE